MRRTANRRVRLAAVLTVASLGLLACGSSNETTSTGAAPSAATSTFKVGLAYDVGGRGDRSFNDAAAAGLDKAVAELGITKEELSPNASGSDRGDNLRSLAEGGFNPVIAVGFAYAESLTTIAADFPDTTFFIVDDASVKLPNVKALTFAEEQGSFLVGAAAALKSKTGNVGYIGGVQTPLLKKFEAGFIAGAKQVKPSSKTQDKDLSQPPDSSCFGSPAKGPETPNGMYDAGADVIYAAAGGSGTGVFQSALAKGKKAIGVDSDQYKSVGDPTLQPVILTSMLKRVDVAVFQSLEKFSKKQEIPAQTVFDLKIDGVGYSESGGFITDITPQLEGLKAKIISGEITVPTTP
ncbi:MAG: BMP family ABC transporter substrate-binding protein [Frankiales bacterium]|nr:BMP family ABC transporter substrate-binding protein [Frankiales bacterium]